MEQDKKKKRVRGEGETQKQDFENENAKRRDVNGVNLEKELEEKEGCSSSSEPEEALGVFDFPWLKDGVMFKTEEYLLGFEDSFSSSLEKEHVAAAAASVDFCKEYGLNEIPEASMIHVPEAKLEDNAWHPIEDAGTLELKAEDVDCIWSSLLNHPL